MAVFPSWRTVRSETLTVDNAQSPALTWRVMPMVLNLSLRKILLRDIPDPRPSTPETRSPDKLVRRSIYEEPSCGGMLPPARAVGDIAIALVSTSPSTSQSKQQLASRSRHVKTTWLIRVMLNGDEDQGQRHERFSGPKIDPLAGTLLGLLLHVSTCAAGNSTDYTPTTAKPAAVNRHDVVACNSSPAEVGAAKAETQRHADVTRRGTHAACGAVALQWNRHHHFDVVWGLEQAKANATKGQSPDDVPVRGGDRQHGHQQ